jgi:hypothetical protein
MVRGGGDQLSANPPDSEMMEQGREANDDRFDAQAVGRCFHALP